MRQVNERLAYSDERIAAVVRADERVERLQTVPSVGPVTAAAFVATLDDAGRFAHAHQVEAYLGLLPREWSSGEGQRRGRITKAGQRRVRSLLVRAAVSIRRLRHPTTTALREWTERLAAGAGPVHRRGRIGPAPGRDPLRAAPRWHPVSTRTGQAHATHGLRGGVVRRLHTMMRLRDSQVRQVGERGAPPGPPHEARNVDGAPTPRLHACAGEHRSPVRARIKG
jgi:hypothetical protein